MSAPNRRDRFEQQGYLVVDDLLTSEEVSRSTAEVDRLHDVARDGDRRDFEIEPFARSEEEDGRLILRKMERTFKYSPWFDEMARHPRLVEILSELLGPRLLLFRSTLMLKPARHGSVHGFHQDTSYWPMQPPHLVTVSIAITDATPENGCFQVIPGSQTWGTRDVEEWGGIARGQDSALTDRTDIDTSRAIHVPLSAGSVLFFHSAVVHGSGPNRSPHPRNTALYAYFTPDVKYVPRRGEPPVQSYRVVAGMDGAKEVTFVAEEEN
ncbi:MAG: hypothetical protein CMJ18_19735 [Phycisphaeraceae bacterium]|nr:hypothetical protein [Phycisphaeraceae bacterium]